MTHGTSRRKQQNEAPVFGTQHPGELSGHSAVPSDSARLSSPAFGTHMAPPVADVPPRHGTDLPPARSMAAITSTHKADSAQMSMILENARNRSASQPEMEAEPEGFATAPPSSADQGRAVSGKSTWNLRIRERGVAGHITGIVNEIQGGTGKLTGLQSALTVDKSLPEYEVLGELGAGAMGVVYRARQTSLNRDLAIKTLKPDLPNVDLDQAMFVSEAVVTAHLVHPNIVPVHDLGRTADGKLFYSMKQVTGQAWHTTIRDLSLEENLEIFMKVCDAVAFAHSRGVINRDLKPENVIVGNYGEVIVLDWGLAITTAGFTKSDSVVFEFQGGVGTPGYMAPELAEATIDNIGPHTDIYLLGAILFEILEGFPPHLLRQTWDMPDPQDQLNSVIWAVLNNEIETVVRNEGELMQIAVKAMSTHPTDRFSTVEELQEYIREYRLTGRAEELMLQVETKKSSSYDQYQSAVALYDEALRKWPSNRRAQDGDRRARKAYAELALKKGDVDLGLQILPEKSDRDFDPVRRKLKRTRRNRAIMRGTWGLATVGAAVAAAVALLFFYEANAERDRAKDALVVAEEKTAEAEAAKEDVLEKVGEIEQLEERATVLDQQAATAAKKASEAVKKAQEAIAAVDDAAEQLTSTTEKLATAKKEQADAVAAKTKAELIAAVAKQQAATAKKEADKAKAAIAAATDEVNKAQKAAYDAFKDRIFALQEIRDFQGVYDLINSEIDKANPNPFIQQDAKTLRKKADAYLKKTGNASLNLPGRFDDGVLSAEGTTLVVRCDAQLLVFRDIQQAEPEDNPSGIALPLPGQNVSHISISADGSTVCAVGPNVRNAWTWNGSDYTAVSLQSAGQRITQFATSLCSPDGRHVYLIGAGRQEKPTLEVYVVRPNSAELAAVHDMYGNFPSQSRILDAVLLPDETGIVALTSLRNVRVFGLRWTGDSVTYRQLQPNERPDVIYPELDGLVEFINGQNFKPSKLALSPGGDRLCLIRTPHVLILPRLEQASASDFPFANPRLANIRPLKCNFNGPIASVAFSRDLTQVAVTQGRYLQIWEKRGKAWGQAKIDQMFGGHSLAAHSGTIRLAGFLGNSNARLVSCAADNSTMRLWNTQTYGSYVTEMKRLVEEFRNASPRAAQRDAAPVPQKALKVRVVKSHRQAASSTNESVVGSQLSDARRSSKYRLTVAPQQRRTALRFQQARKIYSAEFSKDSQRVIVGANDLAAHAFHADTGRRSMSASMLSPRDPFFAPRKNNFIEGHIPEIVSLKFLPPNGELLLTFDYFGSLSVWDAKDDADGIGFEKARLTPTLPLNEMSEGQPYEVEDPSCEIAISPNGRWLIGGVVRNDGKQQLIESTDEYLVAIWDSEQILKTGRAVPVRELTGVFNHQVTAAAVSPDSSKTVTATRRGSFALWDIATGNLLATEDGAHSNDGVSGVFFVSDTEFISAGFDGNVLRWTIDGNNLKATNIDRPQGERRPDFVIRLRPSPDGSRFITSDLSKLQKADVYQLTLSHWSVDGGWSKLPPVITAPQDDLSKPYRHDISWSGDGMEILYVHDGTIVVFDAATLKAKDGFQLPAGTGAVRGAVAPKGPDGLCVATFDGRFAQLWNLANGEHLAEFRSHGPVVRAGFSSDRRYVATGSDSIRIFHAEEDSPNHGLPVFRLPRQVVGYRFTEQVEFSPVDNDYRFASIDTQGNVKLWNWQPDGASPTEPIFQSGEMKRSNAEWMADEQVAGANYLAWSPDGAYLGAVRAGQLHVWKVTGDTLTEMPISFSDGSSAQTVAFNQLDFSTTDGLLTAGGVRLNADDQVESWAAVWKLMPAGARPVATMAAEGDQLHRATVAGIGNEARSRGVTAIVFDDGADEILTGGADSNVLRWSRPSGDEEEVENLSDISYREGFPADGFQDPHTAPVTAMDVAADGSLVTADEAGFIVIWPPGH